MLDAIVVRVPAVPVAGGADAFPVRRIWCVGQNYADHVREMGGDPDRAPPFFFAKARRCGGAGRRHHEVELVAAIGRGGRDIAPDQALDHVYGYAVGLDMTRRDLQAEAKRLGRPWTFAKGFDESCPISPIVPASVCGHPRTGAITVTYFAS